MGYLMGLLLRGKWNMAYGRSGMGNGRRRLPVGGACGGLDLGLQRHLGSLDYFPYCKTY
jgi:hypothetical protein